MVLFECLPLHLCIRVEETSSSFIFDLSKLVDSELCSDITIVESALDIPTPMDTSFRAHSLFFTLTDCAFSAMLRSGDSHRWPLDSINSTPTCTLFAHMLATGMQEATSNQVTLHHSPEYHEAFQSLLAYIYTDSLLVLDQGEHDVVFFPPGA